MPRLVVVDAAQPVVGSALGRPGRGRLRAATEGTAAVLTVENTGRALPAALVATLAEPVRRGTDRVHAAHVGAGLGRPIVRGIVQAHDGELALA
ncbi:MAG TPA: ATP-binding protein, partial [Nocardioides sp.]|nr:ATP-binding protein [Nocardioides sp.]